MPTLFEKLAPYGVDDEDAADRFDDAADLFERIALKYLDDGNVAGLAAALDADDCEQAYRHAHALKGVAGNLSFADLYHEAAKITRALRNGDIEKARGRMPALESAHARICAGLEKLRDGDLAD